MKHLKVENGRWHTNNLEYRFLDDEHKFNYEGFGGFRMLGFALGAVALSPALYPA